MGMEETVAEIELRLKPFGWPDPLIKATHDLFDYMVCLKNGNTITFSKAHETDSSKWVRLSGVVMVNGKDTRSAGETCCLDEDGKEFGRGIYVRLSDVVWVADRPRGS